MIIYFKRKQKTKEQFVQEWQDWKTGDKKQYLKEKGSSRC